MNDNIFIKNGQGSYDSTLLIPDKLLSIFSEKVIQYGGICKLFRYVANSKHPIYSNKPRPGTGKTLYNASGQNLHRVNFRPREEDWEKFRMLAYNRKTSMTFLFSLILMFWKMFEENSDGVPVIPSEISLKVSLIVGHLFTKIQLCRLQI